MFRPWYDKLFLFWSTPSNLEVHNNKFTKTFLLRRRKIIFTFGFFKFHQILHGDAKRVGECGCLWDFVFRKLFYYIRCSEMCKNHDFSGLCLRKVACGDVGKIHLSFIKTLNFTIRRNIMRHQSGLMNHDKKIECLDTSFR